MLLLANMHHSEKMVIKFTMVKVPERENLVKVSLPKHLPIKRNVKVELSKHKSTLFDTYRFTFVRYLE